MRFIGLDVHRDWCDVAIYEDGAVRSRARNQIHATLIRNLGGRGRGREHPRAQGPRVAAEP